MKLTTLFLILICCFTFSHLEAQFSVGIKGGYIKAWEEYGDVNVPDNAQIHVNRFQVSGLTYFEVSRHFSVGLEPGFIQRGAACYPGFAQFLGDTKLLLNYFELPLIAEVNVPVFKDKFELFGKTGLGVSKVISAYRHNSNNGSGQPPGNIKIDLKNNSLNKWDYGMYVGLGISYKIKENKVFIESDYYHGLIDVDPLNTSKNRSIHVGIGYMMNL